VKLPAYDRRSRFNQRLRKSGLSQGQIQHIQNLYNRGEYKQAATYMRERGVSEYRRRATRETRLRSENLREEAKKAKLRKLGTDRFMEDANEQELRQMISDTADDLKRRAKSQRPHNPFWYHTRRSYTERILSGAA
jgi:hypothetical protein